MFRTIYAAVSTEVEAPVISAITTLPGIFNIAINIVLGAGIALTIIFLIIGGIQYITSRGDQKAAETARKSLTNAVIGFIVVVGAFSIKTLLANVLGFDEPTIIQDVIDL